MGGMTAHDFSRLSAICDGGIARNVALSTISQWRIGGCADLVIQPGSVQQIVDAITIFSEIGIRPVIVGLTTNLIFADEGVRVPIIQIGSRMSNVHVDGCRVKAQAGAWVPGFARRLMQEGLTGAEHICGIPGTIGGLVCMNGGSQRKCISSNIVEIQSIDLEGNVYHRHPDECGFSYRKSIFQERDEVITSVTMDFLRSIRSEVRREMLEILSSRRNKFPRKLPNCGSVFKSNPAMYSEIGSPGEAIEKLGLKGTRHGDMKISELHANFIINLGGGTAKDLLSLIEFTAKSVERVTGHRMESEVKYVSKSGDVYPAHSFW